MPTKKPRVTFALPEDTYQQVEQYRFDSRIKNQTQAILSLINAGLEDVEGKTKKAPSMSDEAKKIAEIYDSLDAHGKKVVHAVSQEEARRMAEEAAQAKAEPEAEPQPVRYIRHYLVPSAAGYASPVEGEDYELIEAGPDVPRNADFCIDIDGDSMEPYIKNGQRVYVQRDVDVREFDDAGIWYYAGDVYCKQYCYDFTGALYLLSANRKRRDADKRIPKDEVVNVVCYGRVILPRKLPKPEP